MEDKVTLIEEDDSFFIRVSTKKFEESTYGQKLITEERTLNARYFYEPEPIEGHHIVKLEYRSQNSIPRGYDTHETIIGIAHEISEARKKAYGAAKSKAQEILKNKGLEKIIDNTSFSQSQPKCKEI